MANVSQLQPALAPQVQTSSSEALGKDADFMALRLVNKRARVKLSPEPLDLTPFPGKVCLFAILNSKGWFAAITQASGTSALILSPLADLRSALAGASADDEESFKPQRRVPINGASPHVLIFACNDTRVLLGLADGSIHVYASDQLLSSGEGPVQPVHVFTTSSTTALLSIQPNPGDIPELIAVLRDSTRSPDSLAVELLDVQKFTSSGGWIAGKSPSTTPTSISWSPKGKQLALGLQSGDIVTFSPTATASPKSCIPHPPSANNMSVISIYWLSTTSFHTIFASPGKLTPDVEQIHFHSSLDSKSNSAQDIRFNNPYLPFPGLRPPGEFLVCLRGWNPSNVLLFIGDSTSSDIGLIGCLADDFGESWHNISLEETSTPSLPLDKDQNDTILLGMDIDLTSSESYHHSTASGEALELPAHPIMYVYASDGTVLGWHLLNVTGAPYPGMITAVNPSISVLSGPSNMERELSSDMQTTPTFSPTASGQTETPETKSTSAVFGQPSPFGAQNSTFGTLGSVFGQPPNLGQSQSEIGQQLASTPIFGSTTAPSLFGQPSAPSYGSAVSSGGFGAFSSTGPAKFGQTTFGFGGPPQITSTPSTSVPEENMASDDGPSFGGLGLGTENSEEADSKPSIFGKPSVSASSAPQTTASDLIKPGTGFGAFGGFDQQSPFAKPSAFTSGFSNPAPSPSSGVFGNLQATPSSLVKPASGFFGELPKESPFFVPAKPIECKPVSAFALSATPNSIPSKSNSTQPTFGASSMPGGGFKSVFAPASTTPVQPPPTSSSSAFSAFSSNGSGFTAFSSSGTKSFSDLLRGGAAQSSGPALSEDAPTKPAQPPSETPVSTTPAPAPAKEPSKPFSNNGGAFAAFSTGGNKSFSDLLRTAGEDKSSGLAPSEDTPRSSPPASTTPVSTLVKEPPKPFSDNGGAFAAFSAGGNKSFSALLRTTGDDKPSESAPTEETPSKLAQLSPQASTTPVLKPVQPLPSPALSATTTAKEPAKPSSTPPVVPKIEKEEPETVVTKVNEAAPEVYGGEEEGEQGETGEGEQDEDESVFSDAPSESEAFEEEEEEAVSEVVDEEEAERQVEKEPTPPPVPAPKPSTPEPSMQAECILLLGTLKKELENLKLLAMATSIKMAKLQKTSGVAHQKSDLCDSHKWAFGDIVEFGRLLVDIQADVRELKLEPASLRKILKELDSDMLKVNTRKEEIARFNKAKTDSEFTKMLKIRTLAPEYTENQSQLRKSIRMIRDRVQKLEDHLQASKKRINELRTGRPSLRPPSLDTVNRTFRNIDVAIEQQKQEISQLRHRMASLETSGGVGGREQLGVSSPKRPLNITPNVAITTAAALNAERSAQRLKKALLASRTRPLLNTTAVVRTPSVQVSESLEAPKSVFALPATPMMSFPSSLPAWTPPPPPPSEFGSLAMHDLSLSRNRGGNKHHQKPITLKKSASPAGPMMQPSLFEWKSVEPIKPVSSLPFAIRPAGSG